MKRVFSWQNLVRFGLWVVVPVAMMAVVAVSLVGFISGKQGFLTVSLVHPIKFEQRLVNKQIVQGTKIPGTISAFQNGLGSLSMRFYNFDRINDDVLRFRIRERGSDEWYYENDYKVDQFQPDQLFPFGFPVMEDSKGKVYEYEIESLRGSFGDAVAISRFFPQVTSKYQLKEWQLLDDWRLFGYFILIKILNLLVDNDFLSELLKKILPLISYYLVLLLVSKVYVRWIAFGEVLIKAMRIRKWLFALSISLILMEILAVKESSDLLLLMLSGLWIFNVRFYEYRSNISFCLSVIMLLLYPVVYWFGEELIAEKIAIWGYLLLIMATIQLLSAEFKKLKR